MRSMFREALMGRRGPSRRRLAVKRETLRRLDTLSLADLGMAVGGIDTLTSAFCAVTETCDKINADKLGRTNSKHCLSGDG